MSQVRPARKTRVRIGPRSAGILMTTEEFDRISNSCCVPGYRYELINGVLVVSPPPAAAERNPNDELGFLLRLHKRTHPQGHLLDLTLPEHTVVGTPNRRRCDRAIWCGLGRVPSEDGDVPVVVVEFVSPSKSDLERDYQAKRAQSREAGVREYWIFDRFRRCMTALRFGPDQTSELVIGEGGQYQTDLLPGFVLPIAPILMSADAFPLKKRRTHPKKRRRPRAGDSQ